jgi:hypothetical protein
MRKRAASVIGLMVVGAVLAGCTGSSGVNTQSLDPISTSTASASTVSSSTSASPSQISASQSPSPTAQNETSGTDTGLSADESADRAAVESQWVKSWDVYLAIARTPAADREALVATVAVDPTKANMLSDAAKFDSQGLQTYGTLGHRISWPQPINGGATAVIDDCQDASQSGSMKTATGDKVTVGVARDHYQGSLVKGDDGVWRVEQVFYLKDEPC